MTFRARILQQHHNMWPRHQPRLFLAPFLLYSLDREPNNSFCHCRPESGWPTCLFGKVHILRIAMKAEDLNKCYLFPVGQWFSTFLTLWPCNTAPHVVMTPNYKILSLLPPNCDSATAMNPNVNVWCAGHLTCNPQRGCDPQFWELLF